MNNEEKVERIDRATGRIERALRHPAAVDFMAALLTVPLLWYPMNDGIGLSAVGLGWILWLIPLSCVGKGLVTLWVHKKGA